MIVIDRTDHKLWTINLIQGTSCLLRSDCQLLQGLVIVIRWDAVI